MNLTLVLDDIKFVDLLWCYHQLDLCEDIAVYLC